MPSHATVGDWGGRFDPFRNDKSKKADAGRGPNLLIVYYQQSIKVSFDFTFTLLGVYNLLVKS